MVDQRSTQTAIDMLAWMAVGGLYGLVLVSAIIIVAAVALAVGRALRRR